MLTRMTVIVVFLFCSLAACFLQADEANPGKPVYNSQAPGEHPPTPEESVRAFGLPEGFRATLFAGEPDINQPVSLAFDDRGRLWVAEFYTYAGRGFDGDLRDRIVILEDTNGDGQHDQRTVFWAEGNRLTSVLPGTGGCWILNAGTLAWLPDENGDDRPDGPPRVALDGFDQNQVGHNIVNGLMWGPDGWLYGRHGIQATSLVGHPDDPPSRRTAMNCSIWRYHPQQQRFEVVTAGTTNPWGLDYNAQGEFFFTNNVIGHAWHAIPGARFKRMYGADFNPHYYELIDQHADHYHWDNTASWQDSREDNGVHGKLGGGHSHCGGMIYLGDNWPTAYRNTLFMCNTHGRRVNQDIPVRKGSGYVLQHGQDMIFANQPWFRGVSLIYGHDGGVYLSDWTDLGECHDNDGVHRTSGRIYKITHGQPERVFRENLQQATSEELAHLHGHENEWFVRHARRILRDRHVAGADLSAASDVLEQQFQTQADLTRKLRALWTLHALDRFPQARQLELLRHENEHLRVWGVRLLMDGPEVDVAAAAGLIQQAAGEPSAFVRLYLASALGKLAAPARWELAEILCSHAGDADDHNIPLMIWYGLEPVTVADPARAAGLMSRTKIPLLARFLARRLMHENESDPRVGPLLVEALRQREATAFRQVVLRGMTEATRGWRKTSAPPQWSTLAATLLASGDKPISDMTRELSVVFGDGRALDQLKQLVQDGNATPIDRSNALRLLMASRPEGTLDLLRKMLNDRVLEEVAAEGLAAFEDEQVPQLLLNRYRVMKPSARQAALGTLCSRPSYARALLRAVREGHLPAAEISPSQARQIASFAEPELLALLEETWGTLQTTDAEKQARQASLKLRLTPEFLEHADLHNGRLLYDRTCSACHRLFDSGKEIGPNLTGSNRDNLDYLLENMLAPSAIVPRQYRISTVVLTSGRVLNGLIVSQTERSLTLQTEKELLNLDQDDVELIKPSNLSLMPEGQLDKMSNEEIRDLIGYLQSSRQVAPITASP